MLWMRVPEFVDRGIPHSRMERMIMAFGLCRVSVEGFLRRLLGKPFRTHCLFICVQKARLELRFPSSSNSGKSTESCSL